MAEKKTTVKTTRTRTTTEITIERDELLVLRGIRAQRGWCQQCSASTTLITPEEVSATSHVSVSMIYQWAEMGRLHFADAEAGAPLVCLRSLTGYE